MQYKTVFRICHYCLFNKWCWSIHFPKYTHIYTHIYVYCLSYSMQSEDLTKHHKVIRRKYRELKKKWSMKGVFKHGTNKAIFRLEVPAKFDFIKIKIYLWHKYNICEVWKIFITLSGICVIIIFNFSIYFSASILNGIYLGFFYTTQIESIF